MSDSPDPRIVREIARTAVQRLATDSVRGRLVETAMAIHGVSYGDVNEWHAIYNAAVDAMGSATVTVSWPDEQLQDTPCPRCKYGTAQHRANCDRAGADEQPQDAVERYKTFLRLRQEHGEDAACAAVYGSECKQHGEQPQDERDARIAELEREVRELRGTELNPSPLMLDAQAYGELRDEIAATMGDEWDLDEAEISILIKYVRWLAAGQPRDEDGYPIRRKAPEGLGGASGASRCRNSEATTQPQDDGDVRAVAAMSDARLERLAGLAELPCTCQDADCGNYTSALTGQEARELVAEAKRARAALEARDAKGGE